MNTGLPVTSLWLGCFNTLTIFSCLCQGDQKSKKASGDGKGTLTRIFKMVRKNDLSHTFPVISQWLILFPGYEIALKKKLNFFLITVLPVFFLLQ